MDVDLADVVVAGEVQDARLRDENPRQGVHDLDANLAGALGRGEKSAGVEAAWSFWREERRRKLWASHARHSWRR